MRARPNRPMRPEFHGFPCTRQYRHKDGGVGRHVIAHHLTPIRAIIADGLGWLTVIGLFAGGIWYLNDTGNEEFGPWVTVLIGPWVVRIVLQWLWGLLLRKKLSLSYDIRGLKHHRLLRTDHYDAREIRGFSFAEHPWAQWEKERIEKAQAEAAMQRRVVRPQKYFQNCKLLMVNYHHEDLSLGPVSGLRRAAKIVGRLQAIHIKTVRQATNRSDSAAGDDGWATTSGDYL